MFDPTENDRKHLVEEINSNPSERTSLEQTYGPVYDTQELTANFIVHSFMAPFVTVIRKTDGVKGTLEFQHSPRYYYNFQPYYTF